MSTTISQLDFDTMRGFIEKQCGIALGDDKKYLIESRLGRLLVESGSRDFSEFSRKVISSSDRQLQDKIVDAITTNETLWFRDGRPWEAFRDDILPAIGAKAAAGQRVRIWSAAASTGQEAYSMAMLIDEHCTRTGGSADRFEIVGTDISPSALFIAQAGRYDAVSMNRGLVGDWARYKARYFQTTGRTAVVADSIKKRVKFQRFNLKDSFGSLGRFDVVMIRNVAIYFAPEFKRQLFKKVAAALTPDRAMFLGSSETLLGISDDFVRAGTAPYYRLARGGQR